MRDAADSSSYSEYEKDFMKQTMLEQEAVFKDQVHELHRLYRVQRNLVDEAKGKSLNEDMDVSEHTSVNASKRTLPGFLLPNSAYGEGSNTQACNGRLQNGVSSTDGDAFQGRELKAKRRMIDLQLPADEYLDADEATGENTLCPPFQQSNSGRGDASHPSYPSGSSLDVKYVNGLADLNEPLKLQDSEPIAPSRDMYSHYGRNNADVRGHWLENNPSRNGKMVLEAGHNRSTQRDQLHLPSYSGQLLSNNAFQPQSYPTTDNSKAQFSRERAYRELDVRPKTPQVSYNSYMESSVASNASSLHNDYRPGFVRPWSRWSPSWENPMSSSHQTSYPVQTNPFMYFNTHARAGSSFETRSRVSNGLYQGFSSGSKQSFLNFPSTSFQANASLGDEVKSQSFESLQGPRKQEYSAGLPWLKPQPTYKSEKSNGCFDLNASTNQFMDGTQIVGDLPTVFPHKVLQSASYSNNANMGRAEMIKSQSSTKVIGGPMLEKQFIFKQEHTPLISHSLVKRDLDINLPCDASVSLDQHGGKAVCVEKKEGKKAAEFRPDIDLNSCASEDDADAGFRPSLRVKTEGRTSIDLEAPPTLESEEEGYSSQEKTKEETWELMQDQDGNSMSELIKAAAEAIVAISLSDHQRHPDDATSSSTDAAAKCPLSLFADIITSCSDGLERKVDGSPEATDFEGYREEYSSGEIDYFEAMTLSLQPMKEKDYMPEPLVPAHLKFEETSINRPRRGQARRGRPKRDFQRDILPGLFSLSRQEITEDIQKFGGHMKTTNYTLNSGLAARRNSKRKRLATNMSEAPVSQSTAQPRNERVSVVGLEDGNLTGWGEATRRPRRQRCSTAGNPATVMLT
ncbi:hypothetical protein CARUB_v10008290mg [Capsella rubella]|uniref:Uncharacterized protein n=1 Tax=Capsella rubella TaxID=81985 RepID=R0GV17_9BRAS|nr:uncharacterized protein LOC17900730 [Capsella rubella]XP_023632539.1 uncharacterized protein LOC17900730 [Capsella rubella]EOA39651.1 hypothetical protein CARUB_v10008290mg [Capsella rubella]